MANKTYSQDELSYVQQVMESLSDGVSNLLLAIIPLQDQNKPMPAGVPESGKKVAQLCGKLLEVARELAEEEYQDYPKLEKEILDACNDLEEATKLLIKSIQSLASCGASDRAENWTLLGDSVKVIAGKTIRLLEIVYNCEVKRLWAATKALMDLAKSINPKKTETDAVGMRDDASDLATKADEVADYLRDQAKTNQSEIISDQLNNAADQIEKYADDLLNDTNKLLGDRHNDSLQNTVKGHSDNLDKTASGIQSVLDSIDLMGDEGPQEWLAPDQRGAAGFNDSIDSSGFNETSQRSNDYHDQKKSDPNDELLYNVKRAKDDLQKLKDRAADGDQSKTNDAADSLQNSTRQCAELAERIANDPNYNENYPGHDGLSDADRQIFRNAAEQIRKETPNTIVGGKDLSKHPKDQKSKAQLDKASQALLDALNNLDKTASNISPESDLNATQRKFAKDLDDLKDAAKRRDAVDGADAANRVTTGKKHMDDLGRQFSDDKKDSKTSEKPKKIQETLKELDNIVPHTLLSAKQVFDDPDNADKKSNAGSSSSNNNNNSNGSNLSPIDQLERSADASKKTMDSAAETMRPSHASDLFDLINDMEKELDELQDNSKGARANDVKTNVEDLLRDQKKLVDAAKKLAQLTENPKEIEHIQTALDSVEQKLPLTIKDAVAVTKNPNDAGANQTLQADVEQLKAALKQLEEAAKAEALRTIKAEKEDIKAMEAAAHSGDADRSKDKAKQAAQKQDEIRKLAGAIANRKDTPADQRSRIRHQLEDLDELLPAALRDAEKLLANPNDKKAKNDLDRSSHAINEKLDELADSIQGKPATHSSNKRGGGKNDHHDEIERQIPLVLSNAQTLQTSPNDQTAKTQLLGALDDILQELNCLPVKQEDNISALVKQEKRDIDDLLGDAAKGDNKAVVDDARNLQGTNTDLIEQAKKKANQLKPNDENEGPRRQAINDATERLRALLPKEIVAAKQALAQKEDPDAQKPLLTISNQMKKNAEIIDQNANPRASAQLIESGDALKDAAKNTAGNAKQGDLNGVKNSFDPLDKAADQFDRNARDAARNASAAQKNAILGELKNLDGLLNDLKTNSLNLGEIPTNIDLVAQLDDTLEKLAKLIDDVCKQANAELNENIDKEQRDLDELDILTQDTSGAISGQDAADRAKDALNRLAQDNQNTIDSIQKILEDPNHDIQKDAKRKDALKDAGKQLEQKLPLVVKSTSDSIGAGPSNTEKKNIASGAIASMEKELAAAKNAVSPNLENAIKLTCKCEELGAVQLRDAAGKGDRNAVAQALGEIKSAQAELIPLVEKKRDETAKSDPHTSKLIDSLLNDLKQLITDDLSPSTRGALQNPSDKKAQSELDNSVERLRAKLDEISETATKPSAGQQNADAQRDINDLIAAARGNRRRRDRRGLLDLARALADELAGLVGAADEDGSQMGSDAKRLAELLKLIDQAANSKMSSTDDLDKLQRELSEIANKLHQAKSKPAPKPSSSNAASSSSKPKPKTEPKTLHEKIERTADDIHQANIEAKHSDDVLGVSLLAELFRKLAEAAENGNRSQIILLGRQIHGMIAALVGKIRKLANGCKDKYLKDRLLRLIDPLRNYSTQLKILCSVKAATNRPDADADEQLANVTKSLGNIISETVRSVDTGIRTKRLSKDSVL